MTVGYSNYVFDKYVKMVCPYCAQCVVAHCIWLCVCMCSMVERLYSLGRVGLGCAFCVCHSTDKIICFVFVFCISVVLRVNTFVYVV